MTRDCGHVVYVFRTGLIVMSHGFFAHVTPLGHMTGFMSLEWLRGMMQLTRTRELMDFPLCLTMRHEACDARV